MFYAEVIGSIWATRKDSHLTGSKMRLIQPLTFSGQKDGQPVIAVDTIGASIGERVLVVTSSEAVIPMKVDMAPVDASIVGIVTRVDMSERVD
ncbi:MAG: EutN/CcmL family microcompartment protein [Bacteroidetes bacterium]|nr:EutN/CcmL family microcompartment protein [Bacteroidota bacterium]